MGPIGTCLQFGSTRNGAIKYVDSDFTGHPDKIRSLTGYVFIVRDCAISWKATLETTVALSSTDQNIWQL